MPHSSTSAASFFSIRTFYPLTTFVILSERSESKDPETVSPTLTANPFSTTSAFRDRPKIPVKPLNIWISR